jgi:hypothetical protein
MPDTIEKLDPEILTRRIFGLAGHFIAGNSIMVQREAS